VLVSRRRFLALGLAAVPAGWFLTGCSSDGGDNEAAPTPACDDEPTEDNTVGPFFTPNSPERSSLLEAGMDGTRLVVSGAVLTTACRTVPGAILDFWQADNHGTYDNEGFRLRGHQRADANGRYRLETIVPGLYTGRTRHIHVKVSAPDHPELLTTQLYFPAEADNDTDLFFKQGLLLDMAAPGKNGGEASFDFVLRLA
jgi:protocatechuate 3,4-dioxygenase beta subunit